MKKDKLHNTLTILQHAQNRWKLTKDGIRSLKHRLDILKAAASEHDLRFPFSSPARRCPNGKWKIRLKVESDGGKKTICLTFRFTRGKAHDFELGRQDDSEDDGENDDE